VEFVDIDTAPRELLRRLGKDSRLVPYGGANFGMPLDLIEPAGACVVPNELFFVRSNGPVPVLDAETWRLDVAGHVARPLSLTLSDLEELPGRRLEAFLECAGNGRSRFNPVPPGTPWGNDAIGNAVWEGAALADVLALAGIQPGAVDVVTQGADFPEMRRGLPLAIALDPDVLLAWSMNGEPLPLAHGGPVRLLVPGWAGIASTKWIVALDVVDHAFAGFWNTDNYVFWDEHGAPLRPIAEMPPKSVIVAPAAGDVIPPGPVTIAGWAWSGYAPIARVDVSTDDGETWQPARLHEGGRRGWRRWDLAWDAPPGQHRLLARATDARRLCQPAIAPWNARGYLMNAIQQLTVTVES
jgi:sulfane dehydrogenase subunit SoxC